MPEESLLEVPYDESTVMILITPTPLSKHCIWLVVASKKSSFLYEHLGALRRGASSLNGTYLLAKV